MNSTDREEFAKKMTGLAEIYRDPLSDMALEIYFYAFRDFTYEQFCQGFTSVIKTHKYKNMPNPAEIIEAIEGGSGVKALSAWDKVIVDIRKRGRLQGGYFNDPAITQAVRLCGGWEKICDTEEKNMQFVKKDFLEAFGATDHSAFTPAIAAPAKVAALVEKIG